MTRPRALALTPRSWTGVVILLSLLPGAAWGQESPEDLTEETVKAQIAALEASSEGDSAEKASLLTSYREALSQLEKARQWSEKASEWERLGAETPARLEALKAELALPRPTPSPPPAGELTLAQLEQMSRDADAQEEQARRHLDELKSEPARRTERRQALSLESTTLRQRSAELDESLAVALPLDAPATAIAARAVQVALKRAITQQLRASESELRSYDARGDLLSVRREKAQRGATIAREQAALLQAALAERRKQEAAEAAAMASRLRREAARQSPALHELALQNEALAARRAGATGVSARLDSATLELNALRKRLDRLQERYSSVRRKVEAVGLADAMGQLLRREYEELPLDAASERRSRQRREEIARVQFDQIILQEERDSLGDVEDELELLLAQAPQDPVEQHAFEAVARELVVARREALEALLSDHGKVVNRLVDAEHVGRELGETTRLYRSYIQERILWVRSVSGGLLPKGGDVIDGARWLIAPERASGVLREAWRALLSRPLLLLGILFLILLGGLGAIYTRRRLPLLELEARSKTDVRMAPTLQALALTVGLAVTVPLILWTGANLLTSLPMQQTLPIAWAAGLRQAAVSLFVLTLLRQALRPSGLALGHFRWPEEGVRRLRRGLLWLTPIQVLGTFVVTALHTQPNQALSDSLGRLVFIATMIALVAYSARCLNPNGAVLKRYLERNRGGWVHRLRHAWFGAAVGLPLLLGVLATLGYYYSAIRLGERLELSLGLIFAIVLLNSLLFRWLWLARRRLAIETLRREQEARQRTESDGAEVSSEVELHEDGIDLRALNAQTQRLFRTLFVIAIVFGLLATWADLLPALKRLRTVQIYPSIAIVDVPDEDTPPAGPSGSVPAAAAATPDAPAPAAAPSELEAFVTLADLGLALIALLLTVVATRNVPALLEIILLQRLPLDAGARYAVTSLTRYGITILGVFITFGLVGIGWSKVQWLAAALTFGLAFGLQEIFANFVSGLILFFERPIRVGDMVTVGDITGVVSRIKIRATTITDYTCKELVIPNREFVTGQVVNWSLTDSTLRLIIPVGVAYGSDTKRARELLLEAARNHPRVLTDPGPKALFLGFGESSLSLELHAAIRHPDERWVIQDDLYGAIDEAFRLANVEIAFPQRDLHIRSSPGLERALGAPPSAPAVPSEPPPSDPSDDL